MPPQINEVRRCSYAREANGFETFLVKNDALDSSIDSDSTCSTEIETSLSKESLPGQYDELESPESLRHRGQDLSCSFEDREVSELAYKYANDSKNRREKCGEPRTSSANAFLGLAFLLSLLGVLVLRTPMARGREFSQWRRFLERDARTLVKEIKKTPVGSAFTIRLRGKRVDLLRQSIDVLSQCSSVDEIQVEFDRSSHFPSVLYRYGGGKTTAAGPLSTVGAFLLEEGIVLSCEELDKGFKTWKRDPGRFVGFLGPSRSETFNANSPSSRGNAGTHLMLSDRAAFVHRRYLDVFSPFAQVSCCDTLLSMQVSLASNKPPIIMKGRPQQTFESQRGLFDFLDGKDENSSCKSRCEGYMARLGGLGDLPDAESAILLGST